MFDNLNDARMRLDGGIIRLDGDAIKVREVDINGHGNMTIYYTRLKDKKKGNVVLSSKKLDFSPVPLGYSNRYGAAFYLSRMPIRQWKLGLHHNNMRVNNKQGFGYEGDDSSLASTIEGKYPDIKTAFNSVKNNLMRECAFSRKFAIGENNTLCYKGRYDIGSINEDGVYKLDDEFFYLKEELEEVIA